MDYNGLKNMLYRYEAGVQLREALLAAIPEGSELAFIGKRIQETEAKRTFIIFNRKNFVYGRIVISSPVGNSSNQLLKVVPMTEIAKVEYDFGSLTEDFGMVVSNDKKLIITFKNGDSLEVSKAEYTEDDDKAFHRFAITLLSV